jgi:hypothetical protein
MLGVSEGTAEEFYGRCLANAQILESAAHQFATADDTVSALACAWGADVSLVQAVTWERILVGSSAPQKRYFRAAESLTAALGVSDDWSASVDSVGQLVSSARGQLATRFDHGLAQDMRTRWPDITYLGMLAPPTDAQIREAAVSRLDGMSSAAFVLVRRQAAASALERANRERIRAGLSDAIGSAYESDFLSLEAYLVESATAAGDWALFSVITRWVLVTHAMADLAGLADDFPRAVQEIRMTMAQALGQGDGERFLKALTTV